MATIDELTAVLGYRIEGEENLKKFEKDLDATLTRATAIGSTIGTVAGQAITKLGSWAFDLGRNMIEVNAKYEAFATALTTVEGSATKAKASLDWIREFAEKTPYATEQLIQAFTKLKAYGFDPMSGAMQTLGDTASAMSKPLSQAVEAYADAARGQFQRLNELIGTQTKSTKDEVTFTWQEGGQEMTKTMEKTSGEITKFLDEMLARRFGGGMERASKDWNALVEGMGDMWESFLLRVGEAGFFDRLKERFSEFYDVLRKWQTDGTLDNIAKALNAIIEAAITVAEKLGEAISTTVKEYNAIKTVIEDIIRIFTESQNAFSEWVEKWSVDNIKDKLVQLGTDIAKAVWDGFKTFFTAAWENFWGSISSGEAGGGLDQLRRMFQRSSFGGGEDGGTGGYGGMIHRAAVSSYGGGTSETTSASAARGWNGGGGGSGGTVGGTTGEIGGRLKGDLMRDFSLSGGAASGVVGSLAHESGGFKQLQEVKPMVPGSRGGFGFAQWTGARRRQFEAWAKANNLDPKSYEANYGFLKHELMNTGEGRWIKGLPDDPAAAAQQFTGSAASGRGFLRPGIVGGASRAKWARRFSGVAPGGAKSAYTPAEPNDLDSWINLRSAYDEKAGEKMGTTINGGSKSDSRSVSVSAPVSVHVARADQAPSATAKAVSASIQKGSTATASRFQASPSEVA